MDTITFLGTATTLIRLGSFTLLTDPNFLHKGQRAYLGRGLWTRRLTEPAMQPRDLPTLDAVVLSHLHGDHFDRVARRDLTRSAPVVTTPQAAKRLQRWGFETDGLETWQRHEQHRAPTGESASQARGEQGHAVERLSIESLPGVHAHGVIGKLLPPVMGTLIEHHVGDVLHHRIYVSGDTLTGDHVDAISERHPGTDTAVVHLGGTKIGFATVTMDAEQGVDLVGRLQPRRVVPVHYDDYPVFKSPLSHFVEAARGAGFGARLMTPGRGETVELPPRPQT